jgi:hypothetical protein
MEVQWVAGSLAEADASDGSSGKKNFGLEPLLTAQASGRLFLKALKIQYKLYDRVEAQEGTTS